MKESEKKIIVLEHLLLPDKGFRFFSTNEDKDPETLYDGRIAYKVVGYADTVDEAQSIIFQNFGHSTPTHAELTKYWKDKIAEDGGATYTYHCADNSGVSTLWNISKKVNVGEKFKCEYGTYIVEELMRGTEFMCERISKETGKFGSVLIQS